LTIESLTYSWLLRTCTLKRQGVTQKVKSSSPAGVRFLQVFPSSIPNPVRRLPADSECLPGPCTLHVKADICQFCVAPRDQIAAIGSNASQQGPGRCPLRRFSCRRFDYFPTQVPCTFRNSSNSQRHCLPSTTPSGVTQRSQPVLAYRLPDDAGHHVLARDTKPGRHGMSDTSQEAHQMLLVLV